MAGSLHKTLFSCISVTVFFSPPHSPDLPTSHSRVKTDFLPYDKEAEE
jgi:hypothetical protein